MRALLLLFVWALILEVSVFFYYLGQASKPFEYYLDVFLMFFTGGFLTYLIFWIRRRGKHGREGNKRNSFEDDS